MTHYWVTKVEIAMCTKRCHRCISVTGSVIENLQVRFSENRSLQFPISILSLGWDKL